MFPFLLFFLLPNRLLLSPLKSGKLRDLRKCFFYYPISTTFQWPATDDVLISLPCLLGSCPLTFKLLPLFFRLGRSPKSPDGSPQPQSLMDVLFPVWRSFPGRQVDPLIPIAYQLHIPLYWRPHPLMDYDIIVPLRIRIPVPLQLRLSCVFLVSSGVQSLCLVCRLYAVNPISSDSHSCTARALLLSDSLSGPSGPDYIWRVVHFNQPLPYLPKKKTYRLVLSSCFLTCPSRLAFSYKRSSPFSPFIFIDSLYIGVFIVILPPSRRRQFPCEETFCNQFRFPDSLLLPRCDHG